MKVVRSGARKYWHVVFNGVVLECFDTRREANAYVEDNIKFVEALT